MSSKKEKGSKESKGMDSALREFEDTFTREEILRNRGYISQDK